MRGRHLFLCLLLSQFVTSCSDYEFRLNDKIMYTPLPLFSDYDITDEGLRSCVAQTIEDQKIVSAEELILLSCSHAGISQLDGLARFHALEVLRLPHNTLRDIQNLTQQPELRELDLSHNQLTRVRALSVLTWLEQLVLNDNPKLICDEAQPLAARKGLSVVLPAHCRKP